MIKPKLLAKAGIKSMCIMAGDMCGLLHRMTLHPPGLLARSQHLCLPNHLIPKCLIDTNGLNLGSSTTMNVEGRQKRQVQWAKRLVPDFGRNKLMVLCRDDYRQRQYTTRLVVAHHRLCAALRAGHRLVSAQYLQHQPVLPVE